MPTASVAARGWFKDLTANLRFPKLLLLVVLLFVVDLIVPDFVPFIDEAILGLLAIALANIKKRVRGERDGPVTIDSSDSGTRNDAP